MSRIIISASASSSMARTSRLPSSTSKVPTPSTSNSGTAPPFVSRLYQQRGGLRSRPLDQLDQLLRFAVDPAGRGREAYGPFHLPAPALDRRGETTEVFGELLEVRSHAYHKDLVEVRVQLVGPDDGPRRERLEPVVFYIFLYVFGSGAGQQHLAQRERVRGPVEPFHHPHAGGPLLRGFGLGHHRLPVREYRRVRVPLGALRKLLDDRFDPHVEVAPRTFVEQGNGRADPVAAAGNLLNVSFIGQYVEQVIATGEVGAHLPGQLLGSQLLPAQANEVHDPEDPPYALELGGDRYLVYRRFVHTSLPTISPHTRPSSTPPALPLAQNSILPESGRSENYSVKFRTLLEKSFSSSCRCSVAIISCSAEVELGDAKGAIGAR